MSLTELAPHCFYLPGGVNAGVVTNEAAEALVTRTEDKSSAQRDAPRARSDTAENRREQVFMMEAGSVRWRRTTQGTKSWGEAGFVS